MECILRAWLGKNRYHLLQTRVTLSHKVYQKIKDGKRPSLKQSFPLQGAGGSKIKEWGIGDFGLACTLGPVMLESDMVDAEIENNALLGCNVKAGLKQGL